MWRCISAVGTACLAVGVAGCADETVRGPENVHAGASLRPLATDGLATPLSTNTIYLFEDRDFKGDVARIENVTSKPQGAMQEISDDDSVTSIKWNLPAGTVVLLTQHENGTGDRAAIWGAGQMGSVSPLKFNDKISGWAWYNVGGLESAETAPLPPAATPTTNLPEGTVELYQDAGLRGEMTTVPFVRTERMGMMQELEGEHLADRVSSLRWNLPRGVLLVLHENADGTGRQLRSGARVSTSRCRGPSTTRSRAGAGTTSAGLPARPTPADARRRSSSGRG